MVGSGLLPIQSGFAERAAELALGRAAGRDRVSRHDELNRQPAGWPNVRPRDPQERVDQMRAHTH
jgi:hypothetical protein